MRFRSASNPHGLVRYWSDFQLCAISLEQDDQLVRFQESIRQSIQSSPIFALNAIDSTFQDWCVFWLDCEEQFHYRGNGRAIVIIEMQTVLKILQATHDTQLKIMPNWTRIVIVVGSCDCEAADDCWFHQIRCDRFVTTDLEKHPRELIEQYPDCLGAHRVAICTIDQITEGRPDRTY